MRADRSSTLLGVAAVLALVVVASLSVVVIDSYPMSHPLQRDFLRPGSAPLPKAGMLVVHMFSNQDFSSIVAQPLSYPAPVPKWPLTVTTINASVMSFEPLPLATDAAGAVSTSLLPGLYVLGAPYNTLDIQIPFHIYSGDTTLVQLNVSESAYPLLYSEAANVGGRTGVYVGVSASAPVSSVGGLVTIGAQEGSSAYQASASVLAQWQPVGGTEWLKLEPEGIFDISTATSAVLATWSYSSLVTVAATGSNPMLDE